MAHLLASVGEVDDVEVLQAALLHDTVEDTKTSPEEIEERFGRPVRDLVEEVTDDKSLEKQERKRLQIKKAPHLSSRAKMIKIADKITNVADVTNTPPEDWSLERRQEYVAWSQSVVDGCRRHNEPLESLYDKTVAAAHERLRNH